MTQLVRLLRIRWILPVVVLTVLGSCEKEVIENPGDAGELDDQEINEWIYEWMNTIYLWNEEMPSKAISTLNMDPSDYFESLLYKEEDRWSYITPDYEAFIAELQGTPVSMGYSPAFGLVGVNNEVFMVVEYVVPNTPADRAGLQRGDIITTINGAKLTTSNYRELYRQSSYTAGLARYDGKGLISSGVSVSLTAEVITSRPVIHSEIIEYQNTRIGYLVYVEFTSGINNVLRNQLDEALAEFRTEGIDELIVDFRYNPGGELNMATYLASSIAPASVVRPDKVLVSFIYNEILNALYLEDGGPRSDNLNAFFRNTTVNLNMNRVYFMTGPGTASASELVIIGLTPYMEVVQVGDTTAGKYTGAWVFPDTEDPSRHNYAMVPIVMKYANSEGVTEFKDGLMPDYPINDVLIEAPGFGNFTDPVLAKTLEIITGVNPRGSQKKAGEQPNYQWFPDPVKIEQKNLQFIEKLPPGL